MYVQHVSASLRGGSRKVVLLMVKHANSEPGVVRVCTTTVGPIVIVQSLTAPAQSHNIAIWLDNAVSSSDGAK